MLNKNLTKRMPGFNLNSVLTIIIGGILSFIWSSVVELNKGVVELKTIQEVTQKTLQELVPRAELELRFKAIESQIMELKVRQQGIDLELFKVKESFSSRTPVR